MAASFFGLTKPLRLVEFRVKNYLSVQDEQTLQWSTGESVNGNETGPSSRKSSTEDRKGKGEAIPQGGTNQNVLVLAGVNGSGKTNFIRALEGMIHGPLDLLDGAFVKEVEVEYMVEERKGSKPLLFTRGRHISVEPVAVAEGQLQPECSAVFIDVNKCVLLLKTIPRLKSKATLQYNFTKPVTKCFHGVIGVCIIAKLPNGECKRLNVQESKTALCYIKSVVNLGCPRHVRVSPDDPREAGFRRTGGAAKMTTAHMLEPALRAICGDLPTKSKFSNSLKDITGWSVNNWREPLVFQRENDKTKYYLKDLESAVEEFAWVLAALVSPIITTIILDEPDRSFHPNYVRRLLHLMSLYQQKIILYVSHSPLVMEWAFPLNIYHCRLNERRKTMVTSIAQVVKEAERCVNRKPLRSLGRPAVPTRTPSSAGSRRPAPSQKLAGKSKEHKENASISTKRVEFARSFKLFCCEHDSVPLVPFAKRIVFVEGKNDRKALLALLSTLSDVMNSTGFLDVDVVSMGGKSQAHHFAFLARNLGIPFLVLLDRDFLWKKVIQQSQLKWREVRDHFLVSTDPDAGLKDVLKSLQQVKERGLTALPDVTTDDRIQRLKLQLEEASCSVTFPASISPKDMSDCMKWYDEQDQKNQSLTEVYTSWRTSVDKNNPGGQVDADIHFQHQERTPWKNLEMFSGTASASPLQPPPVFSISAGSTFPFKDKKEDTTENVLLYLSALVEDFRTVVWPCGALEQAILLPLFPMEAVKTELCNLHEWNEEKKFQHKNYKSMVWRIVTPKKLCVGFKQLLSGWKKQFFMPLCQSLANRRGMVDSIEFFPSLNLLKEVTTASPGNLWIFFLSYILIVWEKTPFEAIKSVESDQMPRE
jgi:Overcoming lysogenization defect protein-like, TOPRIM domain/AAA domain, putative AbiEii toxin, Type IV TA system